MVSLFLRNIFFTILQPGVVAGFVPYLILGSRWQSRSELPFGLLQYVGVMAFILGLLVLLICIASFAIKGKGTLSPVDPTKKLVVAGLYKYSRNPMYVGVTLILTGESIFFQSFSLFIYTGLISAAFFLFVKFYEEPRLRKDFGEEYNNYCIRERRWI